MPTKNHLRILCAGLATLAVPGVAISASDEEAIEEIVVTSRFREQTVQDIPASMAVLGGGDLAEQGIQSVRDLASFVPSLNVQDRGPGRNEISIRGIGRSVFQQDISVSPANIGLYLDDVPVNVLQGNQLDVRSFDLNRVEVLRGPQGTLFGEGAQGGALRYFTNDPDLREFSGSFEGDFTSFDGGDDGFGGRIMVNVPLAEDSVGLRLVANRTVVPGYIDNVADDAADTNDYEANNFRAVLLAEPNDKLGIRLMAQFEDAEQGAFATANGDPDDLTLTGASTAGSFIDDEYGLYSLKVGYDFDSFRLESITSNFERTRDRKVLDAFFTNQVTAFRQLFGNLVAPVFAVPAGPVNPTFSVDESRYEQFAQEFRFISNFDGPFNFVAGAFYRDFDFEIESQTESLDYLKLIPIYLGNIALDQATNPNSLFAGFVPSIPADPSPNGGILGEQLGLNNFFGAPRTNLVKNDGEQISAFIEATYEFTDQVSLIAGFRYHDEEINLESVAAGFQGLAGMAAASPPVDFPGGVPGLGKISVSDILPKLSLQYMPNDSTLVYGLYSEGLRNGNLNAGGTNTIIAQQFSVEVAQDVSVFEEEKVNSFEVGFKYAGEDDRLRLNVAAYFNEFEDIQAFITFPGPPAFGVIDNSGKGETYGFEAELFYRINENFSMFLGGNYVEAQFAEVDVGGSGIAFLTGIQDDQPIPFIPDFSYVLGGEGIFPIGGSALEAFGRFTYSYVGEYTTFIDGDPGTAFNPYLGGYGVLNLAFGVQGESFSVELRVNNMLDEREFNQASPTTAVLSGALGGLDFLPTGVPANFMDDWQPVPPRNYILTFRYDF